MIVLVVIHFGIFFFIRYLLKSHLGDKLFHIERFAASLVLTVLLSAWLLLGVSVVLGGLPSFL